MISVFPKVNRHFRHFAFCTPKEWLLPGGCVTGIVCWCYPVFFVGNADFNYLQSKTGGWGKKSETVGLVLGRGDPFMSCRLRVGRKAERPDQSSPLDPASTVRRTFPRREGCEGSMLPSVQCSWQRAVPPVLGPGHWNIHTRQSHVHWGVCVIAVKSRVLPTIASF